MPTHSEVSHPHLNNTRSQITKVTETLKPKLRAQELCESRGGRPGLPSLNDKPTVSVDVKQHFNQTETDTVYGTYVSVKFLQQNVSIKRSSVFRFTIIQHWLSRVASPKQCEVNRT